MFHNNSSKTLGALPIQHIYYIGRDPIGFYVDAMAPKALYFSSHPVHFGSVSTCLFSREGKWGLTAKALPLQWKRCSYSASVRLAGKLLLHSLAVLSILYTPKSVVS